MMSPSSVVKKVEDMEGGRCDVGSDGGGRGG